MNLSMRWPGTSALTIALGIALGCAIPSQAASLITLADPDAQTIVSGEDPSGNKANLVNGVGLGSGYPTFPDTHSTNNNAGWLSDGIGGSAAWLHFDLGSTYTLDSIRLWNYNGGSDYINDRGVRNVNVYGSNSAEAFGNNRDASWAPIASWTDVPTAPVSDAYGTSYDLGDWDMRYVKFAVNAQWGTFSNTGLSEVQFLGDPFLGDTPRLPEPARALGTIDVVLLDTPSDGTLYGTFQSHNQKVVSNENGIFVSYVHASPDTTPNTWRLAHSTDGGHTFSTIYEAQDFTRPPALETDENNYLYLAYPSWDKQQMNFLRFTEANGYTAPDLVKAFDGVESLAKHAMVYDPTREQFYIASQYGQLLTVDKSGNLLGDQQVFSKFADGAYAQYPHLFVDDGGVLHHVQTTVTETGFPYETIRYVQSPDGGATWQTIDGTALSVPTTPGASGPSDMINLPDEIEMSTWLSTMHVKDGKVHFAYEANDYPILRNHYMRYDLAAGSREIDTWTDAGDQWQGTDLVMQGSSALMVSDPSNPTGPLYAVSATTDGHLSSLVSYDNGSTWLDFASSLDRFAAIYAVGGFREITDDGRIIGTFTAKIDNADAWRTYYFQFTVPEPTSLSLLLSGCAAVSSFSLWRAFRNGRGGRLSR